jgi:hypothetical protein
MRFLTSAASYKLARFHFTNKKSAEIQKKENTTSRLKKISRFFSAFDKNLNWSAKHVLHSSG